MTKAARIGGRPASNTRVEQLNHILRSLRSASPDVEASALISDDGLMIASALPQHLEESSTAGISATLSSLGNRAARELERGEVKEIMVRGGSGYAMMLTVGPGTLMLCLTNEEAKLGLVFLDMRRAVEDVRRIL